MKSHGYCRGCHCRCKGVRKERKRGRKTGHPGNFDAINITQKHSTVVVRRCCQSIKISSCWQLLWSGNCV